MYVIRCGPFGKGGWMRSANVIVTKCRLLSKRSSVVIKLLLDMFAPCNIILINVKLVVSCSMTSVFTAHVNVQLDMR